MARAGTATTYNPETGRHETFDEWREWKEQQDREKQRAVQHSAPVTQGAPPKPQPKKPVLSSDEEVIVKAVGTVLGEVERDLNKRIDELAKERRDGLDDIHADYRQLKADIDHAVHSKIADALRFERQKRAQIELRLERALDDIEKLQQQLNGARLYEVGRTE